MREIDERGEPAVAAAAELLALPVARVRAATHYHSVYQRDVDAEIAEADRVSAAAESAWSVERQLLA